MESQVLIPLSRLVAGAQHQNSCYPISEHTHTDINHQRKRHKRNNCDRWNSVIKNRLQQI